MHVRGTGGVKVDTEENEKSRCCSKESYYQSVVVDDLLEEEQKINHQILCRRRMSLAYASREELFPTGKAILVGLNFYGQ